MVAPGYRVPVRYSPVEVADLLGLPAPTPAQSEMISAPHGPVVVVAGAGSGKTETMAARVVWSVANELVDPERVLGLTFTRKATAELAERLRRRLNALRIRTAADLDALGRAAEPLAPQPPPELRPWGAPTVSTYHSFAHELLRENGMRIGLEPESQLMSTAGAVALADDVARAWPQDLVNFGLTRGQVAAAIVTLSGQCAEHLVPIRRVAEHSAALLEALRTLPAEPDGGEHIPPKPNSDLAKIAQAAADRSVLAAMVQAYVDRKAQASVLDHGDLLQQAARLVVANPAVARAQRARFALVLLDEFQDTSFAQFELLRCLFGQVAPGDEPTSVTAVGDPHQSIYAWRGASAANLSAFATEFTTTVPVRRVQLATSWRNDDAILRAANAVVAPLLGPGDEPLRPRPGAGRGEVRTVWRGSTADEAREVAEFVTSRWQPGTNSAAVLCRARSQFDAVVAALSDAGAPVSVVGGGGLLQCPEISDVTAVLAVLADPLDGPAAARLLLASRFAVGPQDVDALARFSTQYVEVEEQGTSGQGSAAEEVEEPPSGGFQSGTAQSGEQRQTKRHGQATPLLGLAALPTDPVAAHEWGFSREGFARLHRLRVVLADLRSMLTFPVGDIVVETIRALGVDVEAAATPGADPVSAASQLDALVHHAVSFSATAPDATLVGFVRWLKLAAEHERGLDVAEVTAEAAEETKDAVTVCTVHAAKGLEWDVVAVPDLVEGRFPTRLKRRVAHQMVASMLPHELRGDARDVPQWEWPSAGSLAELKESLAEHEDADRDHMADQERRLAYVAVTRARSSVLLCGAARGTGAREREPSRFVQRIREELAGTDGFMSSGFADDEDAVELLKTVVVAEQPRYPWPSVQMQVPAAQVARDMYELLAQWDGVDAAPAQSLAESAGHGGDPLGRWVELTSQVLAERTDQAWQRLGLPEHISASHMVSLATDRDRFLQDQRRPVPEEPSRAAVRGTEFHAWIESRFTAASLVDMEDLPGAWDGESEGSALGLHRLQENFLASPWAERTPVAVEVPVEFALGDTVIRGRIDAVFADGSGGYELVDWKTSSPPRGERARQVGMQLGAYQYAWSAAEGVAVGRVRAAFFYAATGDTVWVPAPDMAMLERLCSN